MRYHSIAITTPPERQAVELATLKQHARIEFDDDDALLASYLSAATAHVETVTMRQLVTATLRVAYDCFDPDGLPLPVLPVQGVESVTYLDASGAEQTLDPETYTLDAEAAPAVVRPASGVSWPSTSGDAGAVRVSFVAGHGDSAASVPDTAKAAILLFATHLYENRSAVTVGVTATPLPMAVRNLCNLLKWGWK